MDWRKLIVGSALSSFLQALFYIYLYREHLDDFVKIGAYLGIVTIASSIIGQKTSIMFVKGIVGYESSILRLLARGAISTIILFISYPLFTSGWNISIAFLLIPLSSACFEITELILAKCASLGSSRQVNFIRLSRVVLLISIYWLLPFSPFIALIFADIISRLLLIFFPKIIDVNQKYSYELPKLSVSYFVGLDNKESRQLTISSFLNSASLHLLPVTYSFFDSDKNELGLFFLAQRLWGGASTIIGKAYGSLVISDVTLNDLKKYKIDSIVLKSISLSLLLSIPLGMLLLVLSYDSSLGVSIYVSVILFYVLRLAFVPILQTTNLLGKFEPQLYMEYMRALLLTVVICILYYFELDFLLAISMLTIVNIFTYYFWIRMAKCHIKG